MEMRGRGCKQIIGEQGGRVRSCREKEGKERRASAESRTDSHNGRRSLGTAGYKKLSKLDGQN